MKEINLERILMDIIFHDMNDISVSYNNTGKRQILEAMKEACKQVLKLAAENATMEFIPFNDNPKDFNGVTINEDSILNTINQVK